MNFRPVPGVSDAEGDSYVCLYNSKFLQFWQICTCSSKSLLDSLGFFEHYLHVHRKRSASFKRFSYILREISVTPNVARWVVKNCVSCSTCRRAFRCSTSAAKHTFEASVA